MGHATRTTPLCMQYGAAYRKGVRPMSQHYFNHCVPLPSGLFGFPPADTHEIGAKYKDGFMSTGQFFLKKSLVGTGRNVHPPIHIGQFHIFHLIKKQCQHLDHYSKSWLTANSAVYKLQIQISDPGIAETDRNLRKLHEIGLPPVIHFMCKSKSR